MSDSILVDSQGVKGLTVTSEVEGVDERQASCLAGILVNLPSRNWFS